VGRSLLIGDRESVLLIKIGFWLFMVSFGGPEVDRWWKLNNLSDRCFFGGGSALVFRLGV
jgi:hypothetical protein